MKAGRGLRTVILFLGGCLERGAGPGSRWTAPGGGGGTSARLPAAGDDLPPCVLGGLLRGQGSHSEQGGHGEDGVPLPDLGTGTPPWLSLWVPPSSRQSPRGDSQWEATPNIVFEFGWPLTNKTSHIFTIKSGFGQPGSVCLACARGSFI